MDRRDFLKRLLGTGIGALAIAGCGREGDHAAADWLASWERGAVTLYDTYAMALYFDGGLGPKTGIIRVEYVLANEPVEMEFWHGHGGRNHRYVIGPEHFTGLKQLKRVTLQTDVVADHSHKLFVDPTDPRYRVPGAKPIEVPLIG